MAWLKRVKVVLVRDKENGPLKAYVEQVEGESKIVRGSNLLKKQRPYKEYEARGYVYAQFPGTEIEWATEGIGDE